MTSDHKFALWTTVLTGLPTIIFTGVVAYWTWRRDQERIIVQKSPMQWSTIDNSQTVATIAGVGVMIRNLSLFPVRVAGIFLLMNKKQVLYLDPDNHKEDWPTEIQSHASVVIYASDNEWRELVASGHREKIMDWGFQAAITTETGKHFVSNRLTLRLLRPVRRTRKWVQALRKPR
jgi:hypothetical protein